MRPIPFIFTILLLGLIQVAQAISKVTAKNALNIHNKYRALHGVPALQWNTTLEKYAQNYSKNCEFKHSGGPYGENLGWGYAKLPDSIDAWYNEEGNYDYNNPAFTAGHFTAMVWKSTTQLGCGIKSCDNGAHFYICNYYPPGNMMGDNFAYFKENVLPPK
ncbi:CAP domain-containing protein [Phascolomyces articulosus]|uniref:Golgi-associated plant pathogenesis-related protein 1 n=1 Tax=Phascolomyces articulosus TaxID=60185 RepID=A0AAD5PKP5_9FUNG|nr:CAP domain-containing protein [Phascolomyces articulosus]